jgi:serine phosphatase RsbU (regulator of sigma subunit)
MDRPLAGFQFRWLMLPASWVLLMCALSLPRHGYTGLLMRPGGRVESVDVGSPGALAGVLPGDRLAAPDTNRAGQAVATDPLASATPGAPLVVLRERGGATAPVWIAPSAPPDAERRFNAMLFAVALAFMLLGGWVWSERRDRLTRTFYLLCLAFSVVLAPPPQLVPGAAQGAYDVALPLAQLFLGPLFSHFFALFPESGRLRARAWVLAGYAAATVLFALNLGVLLESSFGSGFGRALVPALQVGTGAVFTGWLLGGLVLFALAFVREESSDAQRRLRVAFFGTLVGALPFAILGGIHNFSSVGPLPGERWTVPLTLLVPLSFAWAMVVHNVFDFRVALRVFMAAVLALLGAGVLYLAGEWVASSWWPALGAGVAGAALAFAALLATLAGPARSWIGIAGQRLVPIADEGSLAEFVPQGGDEGELLAGACEAIVQTLRVEGCSALRVDEHGALLAYAGDKLTPALGPRAEEALRHVTGVREPAELKLSNDDADALEMSGVRWLLPVNGSVSLVLGRRFAGAWLSRTEARALERLARQLAVNLENHELRREAAGHGALAREMRDASAVQAHRLPRRTPVFPTLDCAASTLASEAVGGDYYDFVETGGREFTLAVGDAAGHGVAAALVLAGVQSRFRDEAQRARHPGELLEAMNRDLVAVDQPERFMGLLCARVDAGAGLVRFANAGLTPPFVRRRDGRRLELKASGVLLGVQDGATYPVTEVALEPGDVLIFYTDGLTEASRAGEQYGDERLWQVLDRHAHRRAADLVEELMGAVRGWADGPLDDLTIVVLKQLARGRLLTAT